MIDFVSLNSLFGLPTSRAITLSAVTRKGIGNGKDRTATTRY